MSSKIKGSIQGGVALIIIGAAALYANLRGDASFFSVAWRFLPLFFVYLGLKRAWAYFQPTPPPLDGSPAKPKTFSTALVLTTIGAVWFVGNMIDPRLFWKTLATWWPLLLVVMGLGKLVDAVMPNRTARVSGGEVVFVVFLILFGQGASQSIHWNITKLPTVLRDVLYNSYRFSTEQKISPGTAKLTILRHENGNIEFRPAEAADIRAQLESTIYADSEGEAAGLKQHIQLRSRIEGDRLILELNQDKIGGRANVNMVLFLPKDLAVQAENTHGDIISQDCTGNADLSADNGDIRVTALHGNLKALVRKGSLTADRIDGNATLEGQYADLKLKVVRGNLTVNCLNGKLVAEDVDGTVQADGDRAELMLQRVGGEVAIKNRAGQVTVRDGRKGARLELNKCPVLVSGMAGAVVVSTNNKDVEIDGIRGGIQVKNQMGNVTVSGLPADPAAKVSVDVDKGDAVFKLSAMPVGRTLFLTADGGEIRTELGDALQVAISGNARVFRNFAGTPESAGLRCTVTRGNIVFKK